MSPSFFKGFVLLGFLSLWVTPTDQELTIEQSPNPAIENEPVLLMINPVIASNLTHANWYQSRVPDAQKFIIGYDKARSPPVIRGPLNIGAVEMMENGTLRIVSFSSSQVNFYTVEAQQDSLEMATTVLRSSSSSVISYSFLTLATVLFSSLRLL